MLQGDSAELMNKYSMCQLDIKYLEHAIKLYEEELALAKKKEYQLGNHLRSRGVEV